MGKKITQDDAELMAQIYRDMNRWGTGSVSKDMKKMVEKMDEIRMKKHSKIFNEKSNWWLKPKSSRNWFDVEVKSRD